MRKMRIEVEENLTHTTPHDLKEERKNIKSEKRPRIVAYSGSLLHRGQNLLTENLLLSAR